MDWKKGDRAMIIYSHYPERVGLHVTVISELITHNPATGRPWDRGPVHLIDIPHASIAGSNAGYLPEHLGPIPDHKRFHKALISTDWSRCAFNPMVEIER